MTYNAFGGTNLTKPTQMICNAIFNSTVVLGLLEFMVLLQHGMPDVTVQWV